MIRIGDIFILFPSHPCHDVREIYLPRPSRHITIRQLNITTDNSLTSAVQIARISATILHDHAVNNTLQNRERSESTDMATSIKGRARLSTIASVDREIAEAKLQITLVIYNRELKKWHSMDVPRYTEQEMEAQREIVGHTYTASTNAYIDLHPNEGFIRPIELK